MLLSSMTGKFRLPALSELSPLAWVLIDLHRFMQKA
jgi:hypothetical protein